MKGDNMAQAKSDGRVAQAKSARKSQPTQGSNPKFTTPSSYSK